MMLGGGARLEDIFAMVQRGEVATLNLIVKADVQGSLEALTDALRKVDAGTAELALAPDGRLTSVGHLMIACPFRPDGFARLFLTHPPAGERVRRLEALAGYRR